jgi:endo-1,4-beta-xylanase
MSGEKPRLLARRGLLGSSLAALGTRILAPLCAAAQPAKTESLKRLAAKKGLIYGTTISANQVLHDPAFIALVEQQTGLVVPENDMKWQVINQGAPGKDDYGPADTIAGFAVENGMVLRGHNVLWYYRTPWWFFKLPTRAAQERALRDHVTTLVARYRGIVHSWDVVNEPLEPMDGSHNWLRQALGSGYVDLAYHLARQADPRARLVVNEHDIEFDSPAHETRRRMLVELLQRMQKAGTPVDAVGIQAHLQAVGGPPFSAQRLRRFLAEIAALGLTVQITELDVTDENAPADIAARDRLVADTYRRFLDATLDEPAVKMVVTWGLSDRHSWIVRHETNPARWRKDGLASRPLPFDADLHPKPAFDAMVESFTHAPARAPS